MAACATLLPGETKQVLVKLDSGEGGVSFATVDNVDKLAVHAALYMYETSADGTVFISVSNEGEFGLHFDMDIADCMSRNPQKPDAAEDEDPDSVIDLVPQVHMLVTEINPGDAGEATPLRATGRASRPSQP